MPDTAIAEDRPAGIRRRLRVAAGGSRPAVAAGLVALATLATVGALVAAPVQAPGAWAAGSVSFSTGDGGATADPDYATTLSVSGSGFQSIPGGFGGIYLLFGWVDPGWQPSRGGAVGTDYRYVPDTESKDNAGFQRFVAFPGSDTEAAANAVMDAAGNWSTDFTVPGATFDSVDRTGAVSSVNCLEVQCGLITIGAHGVKNANNETFTPISFGAPGGGGSGAGASGSGAGAAGAGAGAAGAGGAAASGDPAAAGAGGAADAAAAAVAGASAARVGYTSSTAVAGNALSFTGQGFTPGEQVVATLDNGAAAVGPLTAGTAGEVAAVLTIPADARAGTHVLTLSGAASGALAEAEVTVAAAGSGAGGLAGAGGAGAGQDAATAAAADAPAAWPYLLLGVAILVALVLLVVSLATAIVRAARRRRTRRAARAAADAASPHAAPATAAATAAAAAPATDAATIADPAATIPATPSTATGTAVDFSAVAATAAASGITPPDTSALRETTAAPGTTASPSTTNAAYAADRVTTAHTTPRYWTADPASAIAARLESDSATAATPHDAGAQAAATAARGGGTGRRGASAASGTLPDTEVLDVVGR